VKKTKAMISLGAASYHWQSPDAYKRKYNNSLPTYRERKLAKVSCSYCDRAVSSQYLSTHLRVTHGIIPPPEIETTRLPPTLTSPRPRKKLCIDSTSTTPHYDPLSIFPPRFPPDHHYVLSFPTTSLSVACPVSDCMASPRSRERMRDHFARRHPFDSICIAEEGLLPQCRCCGKRLHDVQPSHYSTKTCRLITRHRLHWAQALRQIQASKAIFHIGDSTIENVSEFLYLGRILQYQDLDDQAVLRNLKKTRLCWSRIQKVLSADGCSPKVMGYFYKTLAMTVLLYGSESWVISKRLERRLNSFHLRCSRHMCHRHIRQLPTGEWDYPSSSEILETCKLSPLSTYIARRKTNLLRTYAIPSSELYRRCLALSSSTHRALWWQGTQ